MSYAKPLECAVPDATKLSVQLSSDGKLPYDSTTTGFAHISFYNAVLGRLIKYKSNLDIEPSLLEEARWDFKTEQYVFKIRTALKFHNGRTVTAEDLEFSLVRFFLSSKRVDQIAFLKQIKGVDKLSPGMKYVPWTVEGIKKIDDQTISVKLSSQNPAFIYSLVDGWISIVPREELQDDYVSWKTFPIGAGTYKVEKIDGNKVNVCRTTKSRSNAPENIEFRTDGSTVDIVGFSSGDFSKNGLTKVYGAGPIGYSGIFFNSNNPLGANIHLRKAIALGVNRAEIIDGYPDFSVQTEMLTSNFFGRMGTQENFDINAAKKELAQVPKNLLKSTVKAVWFSGRSNLSECDQQIIERVNQQLKNLGLNVVFGSSNNPTFAADDFETVLRVDDRGTAFPDPLGVFRAYEKPAFLSPFFPKDNTELKILLSEAAKTQTSGQKAKAILAISKYFADNAIVIPLYERKTVYWINPMKVADVGQQVGAAFDIERIHFLQPKNR